MGKRLLTEDDRVEILREVDGTKQDKLTIDDKVSDKSTNPIQNKVITTYISNLNKLILEEIDTKQDELAQEQINNINDIPNIRKDIQKINEDTPAIVKSVDDLQDEVSHLANVASDANQTAENAYSKAERALSAVLDAGAKAEMAGNKATEALTNAELALNTKAGKTTLVSFANNATINLADNTEYIASEEISYIDISYPEGNFLCSLTFTTASSGVVEVKLPVGSKFIGKKLTFDNGETWELSIKNGVVVGGDVK